MSEWVDSGSVPSTGTDRVPTAGNGELGPLAPPLQAASDTGKSSAWEYQHNTTQHRATPLPLLISCWFTIDRSPQQTKPTRPRYVRLSVSSMKLLDLLSNSHIQYCTVSFIPVTRYSGSNFFVGLVLSIMFRWTHSFCQFRSVSLKCVPFINPKTY